jgi:hypothetical protein
VQNAKPVVERFLSRSVHSIARSACHVTCKVLQSQRREA